MNKKDFYFDLPSDLIAQYPRPRGEARLLSYNRQTNQRNHYQFSDLPTLLQPGDLLVMNNSKVIPARFFGRKETGGQVEFLIERLQDEHSFLAHIKASKSPKVGSIISLNPTWQALIREKRDDLYYCHLNGQVDAMLNELGHIPLPPYINRLADSADTTTYQTIYATHKGSVAAPTAGLHFNQSMLQTLALKGIGMEYVTLHIGAGTFRPVRCEKIVNHPMHYEYCLVSDALCAAVSHTKAAGKRVIAVGTTAMRSLETAASSGVLMPYQGDTNIFIYPGYQFKVCDGLLTNFHLPESTLLMLVAAFMGHANAMALYQEAIHQKYRFFSYGDASLLL